MAKRQPASPPAHPPTPRPTRRRAGGKVTTPTPVYGQVAHGGYHHETHDLSPWTETPSSSRVSRYRFDHANQAVQVQWRNNKNQGYIYLDVPYEAYRGFARAASTGKAVNRILNGFEYRPMTPDEYSAGSNAMRRGLTSRVRQ